MKFGVWKKKIGLDNFGSYTSGLDNFWSKWITTVQRAIETPVFPACKNSHFFRIGRFTPGVDHFSNFRIVRDPNYGCRQKFKFIKNIKYEIWSLEKKIGLDNFGSYASGLDNFWSKWITTVQRAIETPVFSGLWKFPLFSDWMVHTRCGPFLKLPDCTRSKSLFWYFEKVQIY